MTRNSIDIANVLLVLIIGFAIGITTGFVLFSPGVVFGQEQPQLWTWVEGANNTLLTVPLQQEEDQYNNLVCNQNHICSNTTNITEIQEQSKLDKVKDNMTAENYILVKDIILLGPYADVMNITEDAANKTEGESINQYIALVNQSIANSTNYTGLGESN